MTTKVLMPKLGMAMSEGKIVEWRVNDGDTVSEGQVLFEMENDKSVQEIESPAAGVIRILAKADEAYPVNAELAEIS